MTAVLYGYNVAPYTSCAVYTHTYTPFHTILNDDLVEPHNFVGIK